MRQAIQEIDGETKGDVENKGSSSSRKGASSLPDAKDLEHSGGGAEDGVSGEGVVVGKGGGEGGGGKGEKMPCDGCGQSLKSGKVAGDKIKFTFREHGGKKYCDSCYARFVVVCVYIGKEIKCIQNSEYTQ